MRRRSVPAPVDSVGHCRVGPVGAVGVGGIGRAGQDLDGGEVTDVLGIGQPVHAYGQVEGGERDLQVVQGGAAAEDQVATIRVGRDQMPVPVGVQLHGVGPGPPAPG